jgi:putative transposase
MAGEGLPVQLATRVLGVSESGYYASLIRPPSARAIRHVWLTDQIREVHVASHGIYGGRRVHAELTLGRGLTVSHGTVEMLMSRAGIQGVAGRPRWRRPRPDLVAGDLVKRDFARSGPNQLWVTDITEHPTKEGKVYCAVVLGVYSRRVVGWSIDASPTAALVTNALGMAIDSRTPPAGAVIHSDRGVQGSWASTGRAKASGLVPRWAASPTASTVSIGRSLRWRSDPCYDRPCGCLRVDVSTVAAAAPGPLAGRS